MGGFHRGPPFYQRNDILDRETRKQARKIVRALQTNGIEFETAAIFVATFLKKRGIALTECRLRDCFG